MKTATRSLWINLVLLLLAFTARAQTTTAISTLATATNAAGGDRILLNQASGSSFTTKQIAVSNLVASSLVDRLQIPGFGFLGTNQWGMVWVDTNVAAATRTLVRVGFGTNYTLNANDISVGPFMAWDPRHGAGGASGSGGEVHITSPGPISLNSMYAQQNLPGGIQVGSSGAYNDRVWIQYNDQPGASGAGTQQPPLGKSKVFEFKSRYLAGDGATVNTSRSFGFRQELQDTNGNAWLVLYSKTPDYSGSGPSFYGTNVAESGSVILVRYKTNGVEVLGDLSVTNSANLGSLIVTNQALFLGHAKFTNAVNMGVAGPLDVSLWVTNGLFIGPSAGGGWEGWHSNLLNVAFGRWPGMLVGSDDGAETRTPLSDKRFHIHGISYSNDQSVILSSYTATSSANKQSIGKASVTFPTITELEINVAGSQAAGTASRAASFTSSGITFDHPITATGSATTNPAATLLAATNAAAANSYGTALWIGTNNAGIGTPWLLVSNGVAYVKGVQSVYGGNNLGLGLNSGVATSAGTENVSVGSFSLSAITNGTGNTAVGVFAMQNATNASYSTAFGNGAQQNLQNGSQNVSLGVDANARIVSGSRNTSVGYQAQKFATAQTDTVSIGNNANYSGSGSYNVAIGSLSLQNGGAANYNVAVGYSTLQLSTNSSYATAFGHSALMFNRSSGVTSIGALSGIGTGAADNLSSIVDANSTFIGNQSGRTASIPNTTPLTNAISLGYNAKALANNTCTIGGTGKEAVALILNPMASQPTNIVVGNPYIYSRTNSSVAELFAVGGDGVETQISPHADDAPPQLYDRTSGDMKEMILRDSNPFITNGLVSFINLRRMARTMELQTRVLLLLGGVTNASTTAALTRLKAMTVAEKQVIATEDFPTYNARTGNDLQPLDWDTVQASVQAAYDLQRANVDLHRTYLTATNAVIQAQISAGDTNATLVALPDPLPVKNVQQPKPAWLK